MKLLTFFLLLGLTSSFSLTPLTTPKTSTQLNAKPDTTKVAAVALSALLVLAHPTSTPASSLPDFDTSITISARSGGRAGGRSSYRAPSRSSYRSAPSRGGSYGYRGGGGTTVIMPMGGYGGGFGMSPFGYGGGIGNFGLGYGLGAGMRGGESVRDYKQQVDIDNEKTQLEKANAELAETKAKEAELEQRLAALEGKQ